MAYAIVRTDLMTGTDDRAHLVSFKYMKNDAPTEIENGNIVTLNGLYEDDSVIVDREVWEAGDMKAETAVHDMVLVASVETDDDNAYSDLSEYINEAGHICRGYRLHSGNVFAVTAEALDGTPKKGSVVEAKAGTKLAVVDSATASTTTVGKIIAVEVVNNDTYYVIAVA